MRFFIGSVIASIAAGQKFGQAVGWIILGVSWMLWSVTSDLIEAIQFCHEEEMEDEAHDEAHQEAHDGDDYMDAEFEENT